MANHTKATWDADASDNGSFTITTPDGEVIASRNAWEHRSIESKANARLISAAPELLEALKDLTAELGGTGLFADWPELKAQVDAAIAKAEGRS